mmetsp:Transcript_50014/g.122833  ORF Transcript_50014/g.122833 Transcript_50014/m.122833 type:complete len:709 (+) Transcript_50014:1556-3682(+)
MSARMRSQMPSRSSCVAAESGSSRYFSVAASSAGLCLCMRRAASTSALRVRGFLVCAARVARSSPNAASARDASSASFAVAFGDAFSRNFFTSRTASAASFASRSSCAIVTGFALARSPRCLSCDDAIFGFGFTVSSTSCTVSMSACAAASTSCCALASFGFADSAFDAATMRRFAASIFGCARFSASATAGRVSALARSATASPNCAASFDAASVFLASAFGSALLAFTSFAAACTCRPSSASCRGATLAPVPPRDCATSARGFTSSMILSISASVSATWSTSALRGAAASGPSASASLASSARRSSASCRRALAALIFALVPGDTSSWPSIASSMRSSLSMSRNAPSAAAASCFGVARSGAVSALSLRSAALHALPCRSMSAGDTWPACGVASRSARTRGHTSSRMARVRSASALSASSSRLRAAASRGPPSTASRVAATCASLARSMSSAALASAARVSGFCTCLARARSSSPNCAAFWLASLAAATTSAGVMSGWPSRRFSRSSTSLPVRSSCAGVTSRAPDAAPRCSASTGATSAMMSSATRSTSAVAAARRRATSGSLGSLMCACAASIRSRFASSRRSLWPASAPRRPAWSVSAPSLSSSAPRRAASPLVVCAASASSAGDSSAARFTSALSRFICSAASFTCFGVTCAGIAWPEPGAYAVSPVAIVSFGFTWSMVARTSASILSSSRPSVADVGWPGCLR